MAVALLSFLPVLGYHYLTSKYVLSAHIYVPPHARNNLRNFTTYVNAFEDGTILRFRTFRLLFGIKSHVVPVNELKLVEVPGDIQAFEKNVEWVSQSLRSRTIIGRKAWYIQPGLGGQEMDVFWRRIGMKENDIKRKREEAVEKMKLAAKKKAEAMKQTVQKYESSEPPKPEKKIKKIVMK